MIRKFEIKRFVFSVVSGSSLVIANIMTTGNLYDY
jgi:hypothetical protein